VKKILLNLVLIIAVSCVLFFLHIYVFKCFIPESTDVDNQIYEQNTSRISPEPTVYITFTENKIEQAQKEQEISYKKGLFSWENDIYHPRNRSGLYVMTNYLGINELYQDFSTIGIENKHAKDLAHELEVMDIDLYILTGHSEWTYEADGKEMLGEIERAVEFREDWGEGAIKGIVFDIEPYGSKRWKQGEKDILMENYVSGMKIAYDVAKEEGIRVILCVPTWYDKHYNEYFAELINYCDEISVMNYVRTDEYKNIIDEVEYAKKLDKDITCIFEFQPVGSHDLTDEQTYHDMGIDAAIDSFESLYLKADYTKLKFAYHYLKPLRELVLD
jgi:hypothetical protein